MKRIISLLLSIVLLFGAAGCQIQNGNNAIAFYYPRSDYGYNTMENRFYGRVIEAEIREDIPQQSVHEILTIYLKGSISQAYSNPYPSNLKVESVSVVNKMSYIKVSNHLSELTGIRLMIACACLSRTVMDMTNTTSVEISCNTALLDGKKHIVFHTDSFLLEDSAAVATDPQE